METIKNIIIEKNVEMKSLTTYKLSGYVDFVVYPLCKESLIELIKYLKKENKKYFILGNGSNILFESEHYEGVIIKLAKMSNIEINDRELFVEAGCPLQKVVSVATTNNLSGAEFLSGIPGTMGGAVVQNAGAYGSDISSLIECVSVLDGENIKALNKEELEFGYRTSIFKKNKDLIVLSTKIKLNKGNEEEIKNAIKILLEKRITSQPLEYPNAGSVFKNPEGASAGKIIDELGLKGLNINDAYVSDKHANFIINKGSAKGKDIIKLINIIKEKVEKDKKIKLILEQEIIK